MERDRRRRSSDRRHSESRDFKFDRKKDRNCDLKFDRKQDLRSRISSRQQNRLSRDRSSSPVHSVVVKISGRDSRSRSPISSRRSSNDGKSDSRKSYQKYVAERQEYLKRNSKEDLETSQSSSYDRKEEKSEKKIKKSKKKHKKERDKRREEKSGSRNREKNGRKEERERKSEENHDRRKNGKELQSHRPVGEEKEEKSDRWKDVKEQQSNKATEEKENFELTKDLDNQNRGERSDKETEKKECLSHSEETKTEEETKETGEQKEEEESDFDDFDEDKLSTLSSSSLSLSSIDDDSQEKIVTPLDGWRHGPAINPRKSGTPPTVTFHRSQSRSRSRSRPFEDRKSHSRSISPPPMYLPSKVGAHSWESRVSEFVRSIGGDPRQKASITFLESVAKSSAPIHLPPEFATHYSVVPPSPVTSHPATSGFNVATFTASFPPPPIDPSSASNLPQIPPKSDGFVDSNFHSPMMQNRPPVRLVEQEVPVEEEPLPPEEIVLTPLIKFVGQKLADKKLTHLASLKEGFFRYNLLSVASRGEWVAAKVLETFDKFGFTESSMYNTAVLKGRKGFKEYLQTAISTQKVNFGPSALTSQDLKLIHCVVDLIVKYFTFDGTENDEEEFDFEEENDEPASDDQTAVQTRRSGGLAEVVKHLSNPTKPVETAESIGKSPEISDQPDQPPINPWSNMWNWMQSENFKTFLDLKKNLAKGFLGSVGTSKFGKNPFVAAQDLVSCWVIAGLSNFYFFIF